MFCCSFATGATSVGARQALDSATYAFAPSLTCKRPEILAWPIPFQLYPGAPPLQQVSAFAPWSSLPRHRFDPTSPATPTSTPRYATAGSSKSKVRHRLRTTVLYEAAATPRQSPSEPAPEAENGGKDGEHDPVPLAAAAAAAAAAAGAPSYRRLYDAAMRLLESELELEPYPIPAGLEGNSAVVGKGRNQQVWPRCAHHFFACVHVCRYNALLGLEALVCWDVLRERARSLSGCRRRSTGTSTSTSSNRIGP